MPPSDRVSDRLDPEWLAAAYRRDPALHAWAVWDRAVFPERVEFRVLEHEGRPRAYLLIWHGLGGFCTVHWVGPSEGGGPLLEFLPRPPVSVIVPDELAPEVLHRLGTGRVEGVRIQVCR
ncbi:MAG: hypothetical protein L3J72_02350, partial [Thermoplasmata archaeon]|nr:hypothetical protein [Thermoplasmata archaeon]